MGPQAIDERVSQGGCGAQGPCGRPSPIWLPRDSESRDPSRVRLLTHSGALKQALLSASAAPCLPFSPVLLRDSESLSRLLLLSDGPRSTAPQRVTAPRVVTAPRLLAAVRRIRAPTPPRCGAVSARRSSKPTRVCKVRVVNATQSPGSAQCSAPSRSPTRSTTRSPTQHSVLSAQRPAPHPPASAGPSAYPPASLQRSVLSAQPLCTELTHPRAPTADPPSSTAGPPSLRCGHSERTHPSCAPAP